MNQELPRRSVFSICIYTIYWLGISLRTFLLWQNSTVSEKKILVTEVAILAACANRNRLPNFSIGNPHYFLYYILNKRRLLNCKLFKSISFCTDEFFQVFQNWKMWYGLFYIFKAGRRFCILGKYLWLLMMFLVHYICCTFYKFQSSFIYYFTFNL